MTDSALLEGCIELFRNGDVAVTTNGVKTVTPRGIPFPHDGCGQDGEWVEANFTNGTAFAVSFTPATTGVSTMTDSASVTFVEWETRTAATWPQDRARRTIGVCEEVSITLQPVLNGVALSNQLQSSQLYNLGNGCWTYIAADIAAIDEVSALTFGSLFSFNILAPTGYDAQLTKVTKDPTLGISGAFKMHFDLVLLPTNVSFSGIQIAEVGMTSTNAIGYFAEPRNASFLVHTPAAGANVWTGVGSKNTGVDEAQIAELPSPWSAGSMSWPIPNKYRRKQNPQAEMVFCNTDQHFAVDVNGTATESKFDWFATATTNRVFNYGRTVSP